MKTFLLFLTLAATPGCFLQRTHVDQPIESAKVAELVPGRTTAGETVEMLGAPNEVVQLGRKSAYRYQHDVQKSAGLFLVVFGLINRDTQSDRTWVFFDESDVLTHVGTTLQSKEAEYAMPWVAHD